MRAQHTRFGSLGWRLLAAFVAVAVGAVGLLALVAAVSVDRRTSALIAQQRTQLEDQVAAALSAAYTAGRGTWRPQDLATLQALTRAQGAHLVVWDHAGQPVTTPESHDGHASPAPTTPAPSMTHQPTPTPTHHPEPSMSSSPSTSHHPEPSPSMSGMTLHDGASSTGQTAGTIQALPVAGSAAVLAGIAVQVAASSPATASPASTPTTPEGSQSVSVPIVVNGTQVGTAQLTLPSGAESSVSQARAALLRSLLVGTLLALLLAVAASVVVSRRVSRPLVALAAATRSFAAGEPHPDRLIRRAPGELGEVGRAFTAMTATLTHQDEQRRALVADVAHELRTPVAILRGQTEQLLDGIAEPTPDRLVSLHDEVLRLERVTGDLATLSAADAAGLALRTEPVDLGRLAARTVDAMQAHFDDAELTAHADVDEDVVVHGDPTRLSQVVTNLLTNATKFTPPGGRITVEVHRVAQSAELVVTDTGPGIPPDELPHLFDRFWRGRAAGTRSGTGIGLSVVASLVAAHGGTVTARAPADGGAQFTVTLPIFSRPGPAAEGSTVGPVAR
jgi:two-component system sensor histidine kinase BaeS